MPFAEWDVMSLFVLFAIAGFLGEGVVNLTNRMLALRERIRQWAIGLGIISGIIAFFALASSTRNSPAPNDLLGAIFGGGLAGICAGLVWYLVVAVVTFAYQHIIAPPFRCVGRSVNGRFRVGSFSLFCGLVGFIAGIIQVGSIVQGNPSLGGGAALGIVGAFTIGGTVAGYFISVILGFLRSQLTLSKVEREKRADERRRADELRRIQDDAKEREAAQRRSERSVQADRDAARKHLADFYSTNKEFLADLYPKALMDAFFRSEMPDTLTPVELWAICQKKIAELQPIVLQGRAKKKAEEERVAKRNVRLKQLDGEIRTCRDKIARLAKSELDAEFIEDETQGLLMKIRQLEEQKELLLTLNDVGNV